MTQTTTCHRTMPSKPSTKQALGNQTTLFAPNRPPAPRHLQSACGRDGIEAAAVEYSTLTGLNIHISA